MFIDKQLEFSDSQAVTVTAISTNVVDTLPMAGNPNVSQNLGGSAAAFLVVQVDTAFAAGTSLAISLESDSTANLATSPTVHFSTAAILPAGLAVGTILVIPLPIGEYERYLGLRYTAVGTFSAGNISAFITKDIQNWRPYASGSASN